MTKHHSALALVPALIFLVSSAPVRADDTGLASMHDWRVEGGRTCYAEHTHYGSSAGLASKKLAEVEAIKSWQSFTAFEYGTDWANFARAASRKVSCKQGSGGWGCEVEARPCNVRVVKSAAKGKKK